MSLETLRAMGALKNFSRQKSVERCELCSLPLLPRHQHLIDPSVRRLVCTCDGCSVLFDENGATPLRRVPRDVRKLTGLTLPAEAWKNLLVPINLAFFYKSSHAGRVVALYPSAVGVTEALVEEEPWSAITTLNPRLAALRDDIEALLINRLRDRSRYVIAPIDRCFELVGLVRKHWSGFSGGDRVHQEIREFFEKLEEEALP